MRKTDTKFQIALDEFLQVVSHELRTPLSSISLAVTSMKQDATSESLIRKLQVVERSVARLVDLVSHMTAVTAMAAPRPLEPPVESDFRDIVRSCTDMIEPVAEKEGVGIALRVPEAPLRGNWDRDLVSQVVTNLLTNAVKYGLGRPVDVSLVTKGEQVELRVRDRGEGVKPQDRERIFGRFERAGVKPGSPGGMGLGLWIASEATRSMGGRVWVEDPKGGGAGSVFCLELPLFR